MSGRTKKLVKSSTVIYRSPAKVKQTPEKESHEEPEQSDSDDKPNPPVLVKLFQPPDRHKPYYLTGIADKIEATTEYLEEKFNELFADQLKTRAALNNHSRQVKFESMLMARRKAYELVVHDVSLLDHQNALLKEKLMRHRLETKAQWRRTMAKAQTMKNQLDYKTNHAKNELKSARYLEQRVKEIKDAIAENRWQREKIDDLTHIHRVVDKEKREKIAEKEKVAEQEKAERKRKLECQPRANFYTPKYQQAGAQTKTQSSSGRIIVGSPTQRSPSPQQKKRKVSTVESSRHDSRASEKSISKNLSTSRSPLPLMSLIVPPPHPPSHKSGQRLHSSHYDRRDKERYDRNRRSYDHQEERNQSKDYGSSRRQDSHRSRRY